MFQGPRGFIGNKGTKGEMGLREEGPKGDKGFKGEPCKPTSESTGNRTVFEGEKGAPGEPVKIYNHLFPVLLRQKIYSI